MKVFIACSGSDKINSEYKELASSVATILARSNYKLVYEGGDTHMRGSLLLTYKYEGGKVKGIIDINEEEKNKYIELDALDILPNTYEKTKKLYQDSDLIIILPGGIEVLSDFFTSIQESYNKDKSKKIILFNYNHFFTPLLNYLTELYKKNFIDKNELKNFEIIKDLESLEKYINIISKENY